MRPRCSSSKPSTPSSPSTETGAANPNRQRSSATPRSLPAGASSCGSLGVARHQSHRATKAFGRSYLWESGSGSRSSLDHSTHQESDGRHGRCECCSACAKAIHQQNRLGQRTNRHREGGIDSELADFAAITVENRHRVHARLDLQRSASLLIELFRDRLPEPDELGQALGHPVLATIPTLRLHR